MTTRYYLIWCILLVGQVVQAQTEMADDFRGEGKIYVLVLVILAILAGFFFLLFKLDKRTKRLEKEVSEK
ncbi:MAG: hypothetical protein Tsb0034_29340 [Ekhidna sp.]